MVEVGLLSNVLEAAKGRRELEDDELRKVEEAISENLTGKHSTVEMPTPE